MTNARPLDGLNRDQLLARLDILAGALERLGVPPLLTRDQVEAVVEVDDLRRVVLATSHRAAEVASVLGDL